MLDVANLITAQHVILDESSLRRDIISQNINRFRFGQKVIRVNRNHNFELMESMISVFGSYSGFEIKTLIGSYDDSMSFSENTDKEVDADILWIDYSRYNMDSDSTLDFVVSRINALRNLSRAPIFVCDHPDSDFVGYNRILVNKIKDLPNTFIIPVSKIAHEMGDAFYDYERSTHFGTTFDARVFAIIARLIGLKYLPAVFRPRIKAIAIDLDNTLYNGVLGEDGANGVRITEGHRRLQEELVKLGNSGILLSVTSKNIEQDVDILFTVRTDFPLRPEHLAGRQINWDSKAANIRKLAKTFNISPSDFLLLDDNPGEIVQVAADIELIDVMHASDDADTTVAELRMFPGLFSFGLTNVDLKRTQDIIARQHRIEQQQGLSVEQYLAQMGTKLGIYLNETDAYERLCQIPIKTNQFNLALQRLSASHVRSYLDDSNSFVASISLKDKLSNSGNVGALYGHQEDDVLVVDEICVSCRALGRGIENLIIAHALRAMIEEASGVLRQIRFRYRFGPRNQPAIKWLKKFTEAALPCESEYIEGEVSQLNAVDYPVTRLQTYLENIRAFPVKVFLQTSY